MMPMLRVLVTGGRRYSDVEHVCDVMESRLARGGMTVLIHGGCPKGLDRIAAAWAAHRPMALAVEAYPVDHALDGPWPAAGPRRNQRMLEASKPDVVLAFTGGRGTADMVRRALRMKVPVEIQ